MKTLKAVAVENGAIVATAEDGSEFRIHVDDELRAKLRGTPTSSIPTSRRSSPREIQTYIRGGMSAEQVAKFTGAPLDYVVRSIFAITLEVGAVMAAAEPPDVEGATEFAASLCLGGLARFVQQATGPRAPVAPAVRKKKKSPK